jgi:hypothetical protein
MGAPVGKSANEPSPLADRRSNSPASSSKYEMKKNEAKREPRRGGREGGERAGGKPNSQLGRPQRYARRSVYEMKKNEKREAKRPLVKKLPSPHLGCKADFSQSAPLRYNRTIPRTTGLRPSAHARYRFMRDETPAAAEPSARM